MIKKFNLFKSVNYIPKIRMNGKCLKTLSKNMN